MLSGPQFETRAPAAAPSHAWRPSCWIHRSRNEQAFDRHSKGRCRQPLAPTKAMNRMRAIAAHRSQSSLTGGCFELRIVRICTEFCGSEGEPDRPDATGPGSVRFRRPPRIAGAGEAASWSRGAAHVRATVRSRSEDERRKTRRPCKCASVKTASRVYRFARRGVHATVKEVLTRAIAASNHWRIIRNWATQHF